MTVEPLPGEFVVAEAAATIPYAFARRFGVVVQEADGPGVRIAMREGADPKALLELRRHFGRPFGVGFVAPEAFDRLLSNAYAMDGQAAAVAAGTLGLGDELDLLAGDLPTADDLLDTADDAPAIRLINGIIADAARNGVSDIHIEPYETGLVVRMRIDGVLRETLRMPPHVAPVVVSRVKVMARLDIAERRVPQDGRIGLTLGGKLLDVRVSTLPSRAGERVVLRILDKDNAGIDLGQLGLTPGTATVLRAALAEPNGIVLVTGPTGSGKTTSLYAALRTLNDGTRNILTVEDPVEYAVDGVGQTQVNPKVGLTFAAGLRAILRQDPDVVMVGEIRDRETAEIAVQASLTGHLVLSTVHTNDAVGAITRMRDMRVEPFLLASTLRAVIAQRLVRRLCEVCRRQEPATASAGRDARGRRGYAGIRAAGLSGVFEHRVQGTRRGVRGGADRRHGTSADQRRRRRERDRRARLRPLADPQPGGARAGAGRSDHAGRGGARVAARGRGRADDCGNGVDRRGWLTSTISRSTPGDGRLAAMSRRRTSRLPGRCSIDASCSSSSWKPARANRRGVRR